MKEYTLRKEQLITWLSQVYEYGITDADLYRGLKEGGDEKSLPPNAEEYYLYLDKFIDKLYVKVVSESWSKHDE